MNQATRTALEESLDAQMQGIIDTLSAIENESVYNEMVARYLTPEVSQKVMDVLSPIESVESIPAAEEEVEAEWASDQELKDLLPEEDVTFATEPEIVSAITTKPEYVTEEEVKDSLQHFLNESMQRQMEYDRKYTLTGKTIRLESSPAVDTDLIHSRLEALNIKPSIRRNNKIGVEKDFIDLHSKDIGHLEHIDLAQPEHEIDCNVLEHDSDSNSKFRKIKIRGNKVISMGVTDTPAPRTEGYMDITFYSKVRRTEAQWLWWLNQLDLARPGLRYVETFWSKNHEKCGSSRQIRARFEFSGNYVNMDLVANTSHPYHGDNTFSHIWIKKVKYYQGNPQQGMYSFSTPGKLGRFFQRFTIVKKAISMLQEWQMERDLIRKHKQLKTGNLRGVG